MIILDASVLIGYLESTNGQNRSATNIIAKSVGEYLMVPAVTWAEVLVGAVKKGKEEEAIDVIQRRLGIAVISPEGVDWPQRLAEVRANSGLKMLDAIVLATAEVLDGQVASLDDKLRAAAATESRLYAPDAE